ncbi:MAG: hypothetical protein K1X48_04145 [Burkholderiaceae bacterium]|nr:hypothetical protein [Burkholderiaceae bacterium]
MFSYTSTTTENRRDRLAEIVFKTKLPEWEFSPNALAERCYQYADAMIAAGKEKENDLP